MLVRHLVAILLLPVVVTVASVLAGQAIWHRSPRLAV